MNLDEAVAALNREDVPPGYYELGGLGAGEIWGIRQYEGKWEVYYSERGEYRNIKLFDTESKAVEYFLRKVGTTVMEYDGRNVNLIEPH